MAVTPRYAAQLENSAYRKEKAEIAKRAVVLAEEEYNKIVSGQAAEEARIAALMQEQPLFLDDYGRVVTEVSA